MKRILIACATGFIGFMSQAADMASQPWVNARISESEASIKTWTTDSFVAKTCELSWGETGTNCIIEYNGKIIVYPITISISTNDQDALWVVDSNMGNIPQGSLFAFDVARNGYRNSNIAMPPILEKSLFVTNGHTEVVLSYEDPDTHIKFDSYQRSANVWRINRYDAYWDLTGTFSAVKAKITRHMANEIGVTNAITRKIVSRRDYSNTDSYFPQEIKVFYQIDGYPGGGKDVYVNIAYKGPFTEWLDPDEAHYYEPRSWPSEGDWNKTSNWFSDPITLKNIPVDKDSEGNWIYKDVSLSQRKFEQKFGSMSSYIPKFERPEVKERRIDPEQESDEEECRHIWMNCWCTKCDTIRNHCPDVREGHEQECARCINFNGKDGSSEGTMCGSHKMVGSKPGTETRGNNRTDVTWHFGWYHNRDEGIENSPKYCRCECGDYYNLQHLDTATGRTDYHAGQVKEENGAIVIKTDDASKSQGHYFTVKCSRPKGGESTCSADMLKCEAHNPQKSSVSSRFVYDTIDPDTKVPHECNIKSNGRNEEKHAAVAGKCRNCNYETSYIYEPHTFGNGCTCSGCGCIVHQGNIVECGSSLKYCDRCFCVPNSSETQPDEKVSTKFDDHGFSNRNPEVDKDYHYCICGMTRENHYDASPSGDPDGFCDACNYWMGKKTPDEEICERKGHKWINCYCENCHITRNHVPGPGLDPTMCWTCQNLNSDQGKTKCGSTKLVGSKKEQEVCGGNITEKQYHRGWHHINGIENSTMYCCCQCGDWGRSDRKREWHEGSEGSKTVIGPGKIRIENGKVIVIQNSEAKGHYYSNSCNHDQGNGNTCGALIYSDEDHNPDPEKSGDPFPYDTVDDEGVPHECSVKASGRDQDQHAIQSGTCLDCGYDGSYTFANHDFLNSSTPTYGNCECTKCYCVVHHGPRVTCGSVTYCQSCNYVETPDGEDDYKASTDPKDHEFTLGVKCTKDANKHWCNCELASQSHYDTSPKDGYCDYCKYKMGEEDPDDPRNHKHYPLSGTCGDWKCSCGVVLAGGSFTTGSRTVNFPTSHDFNWCTNYPHCQACRNINPITSTTCGKRRESDYTHCGFHDEDGKCVCECGAIECAHNHNLSTNYWFYKIETVDGRVYTNCYQRKLCDRKSSRAGDQACGFEYDERVDHDWKETNEYVAGGPNDTPCSCLRNKVCRHAVDITGHDMCGAQAYTASESGHSYWFTGSASPIALPGGVYDEMYHSAAKKCSHKKDDVDLGCGHVMHTNQLHNIVDDSVRNETKHNLKFKCKESDEEYMTLLRPYGFGIGCNYVPTNTLYGNHSGPDSKRSYTYFTNGCHVVSNTCTASISFRGKAARCGVNYKVGIDYCNKDEAFWSLSSNTNEMDICKCSLCMGNTPYEHAWSYRGYDEAGHYCKNGGGHLYLRPHDWNSESNRCETCDYNVQERHAYECKCGCGCYIICDSPMPDGNIIESSCAAPFEPDGYGNYVCKCAGCIGDKGWCECEIVNNLICVTDNVVNTNRYKSYWANGPFTKLNGLDPVYHVKKSGFEFACSNCLSLAEVDMSMCTNAEERAFYGVCFNCTNLTTVKFSRLETAGKQAFYRAFSQNENMPSRIRNVDFGSLKHAGSGSFAYAFTKAVSITEWYFSKLETVCDDAFNSAWDGITYGTETNVFNFSSLKMGIVHLGETHRPVVVLATNIAKTAVIDVSNLHNLRKIRFDCVSEVVAYNQSWIPLNSDYEILVPWTLIESWKNATGWCAIAEKIKEAKSPQFTPWVATCEDDPELAAYINENNDIVKYDENRGCWFSIVGSFNIITDLTRTWEYGDEHGYEGFISFENSRYATALTLFFIRVVGSGEATVTLTRQLETGQ